MINILLLANLMGLAWVVCSLRTYSALGFLFPLYIFSVSTYSIIGGYYNDFALALPFDFHVDIYHYEWIETSLSFLLASVVFTMSYSIGNTIFQGARRAKSSPTAVASSASSLTFSGYISFIMFVIFCIILHAGYGWSDLYYRSGYVIGDSGSALARKMLTLVVPGIALIISLSQGRLWRQFALVVGFFLLVGTGSRMFLIFPAFFLFGRTLIARNFSLREIALPGALLFLGLSGLFAIRYSSGPGGVVPNSIMLFEQTNKLGILSAINYSLSFTFFATMETTRQVTSDTLFLLESLTPIPSGFFDASEMVDAQKLNVNAPYTAFGIIFFSLPLTVVFFGFLGIFWAWALKNAGRASSLLDIAIIGAFFAFIVFFSQYNLRGAMRIVYAAAILRLLRQWFKLPMRII